MDEPPKGGFVPIGGDQECDFNLFFASYGNAWPTEDRLGIFFKYGGTCSGITKTGGVVYMLSKKKHFFKWTQIWLFPICIKMVVRDTFVFRRKFHVIPESISKIIIETFHNTELLIFKTM